MKNLDMKNNTNTNTINLNTITSEQVIHLDQDNTNGDGWTYYCNGQILCANVFKDEISGVIHEFVEDFSARVKVDDYSLTCSCSCSSDGVVCKHIVALLYSWVYDRQEFVDLNSVIENLHNIDKESIIKMIERFLVDDPRNLEIFKKTKELEDIEVDGFTMV
jgi:uncharacterized Zn finger protein